MSASWSEGGSLGPWLDLTYLPAIHPQVLQNPQRGRGAPGLPAPRPGRDGEEGDRAHGLRWAPHHLCSLPRLPQQP